MEEFNLSDKRQEKEGVRIEMYCYDEEDVKEFIKRLKEEIQKGDLYRCANCKSNLEFIDKLAGDKLI